MNTTFNIEITFREHQARQMDIDGVDFSTPKHSCYHAHIITHGQMPLQANYQSPWIMEWDDEDKPTELMPPNEALFALLNHVKQAISAYNP